MIVLKTKEEDEHQASGTKYTRGKLCINATCGDGGCDCHGSDYPTRLCVPGGQDPGSAHLCSPPTVHTAYRLPRHLTQSSPLCLGLSLWSDKCEGCSAFVPVPTSGSCSELMTQAQQTFSAHEAVSGSEVRSPV